MPFSSTLKESGDAGATWLIEGSWLFPGDTFELGIAQWNALAPSRLKSFLTQQFGSLAALADAVATANITTSLTGSDTMGPAEWRLDGSGYPIVSTFNMVSRSAATVQIRLPHSSSI